MINIELVPTLSELNRSNIDVVLFIGVKFTQEILGAFFLYSFPVLTTDLIEIGQEKIEY